LLEFLGDEGMCGVGMSWCASDGDSSHVVSFGRSSSWRHSHFSTRNTHNLSHSAALTTKNVSHKRIWHLNGDFSVGSYIHRQCCCTGVISSSSTTSTTTIVESGGEHVELGIVGDSTIDVLRSLNVFSQLVNDGSQALVASIHSARDGQNSLLGEHGFILAVHLNSSTAFFSHASMNDSTRAASPSAPRASARARDCAAA